MAQEEADVHRRFAKVSRLVIDKREAGGVGEQVLGAEIAVTESELRGA